MFMFRTRLNRKGTSLVEVLVVMVVLLVGIMTVIQMFPTGFGVVKAAESRTIATKLAQQEIERWKAMSANLPTGILPIYENGDVRNGQYPGSPFAAFIGDTEPYARGNVLNIRWIREETTPIPAPVYFTTGTGSDFGSRYTLAFSPIDVYAKGDGYNGLSVKSGPLKRIVSPSITIMPDLKQGQYAVYYGNEADRFYVAFPQDTVDRIYYISYSYWATNPQRGTVLMTQLDQRIPETDVLPYTATGWQEVIINYPAGYDPVGVEPNTDTCARGFKVSSGNWSADPYEFKLADPILGVLAFNPNAQRLYEYTALGKRPIEARIDYRIYDPRIIREDKVVPDVSDEAEDIPIKLALRFILDAGDPDTIGDGDPTDNPDEPTFEGLMRGIDGRPQLGTEARDADDLIIPFSMMIVDLKTGFRVGVPNPGKPDEGIPIDSIDYKTGVVNLPLSGCLMDYENKIQATVDLRDRYLRFFYRADGDWSVQCQKAYSNYSRVYDKDLIDYCHYYHTGGLNDNRLLFAPCDAEKAISVDYTYIVISPKTGEVDGTGEHRVVGQACRISDTYDGDGYYFVDIPVPVTSYEIKRIAVIGTSFKARVIWRDGKRWRYVDQETNLIRGNN